MLNNIMEKITQKAAPAERTDEEKILVGISRRRDFLKRAYPSLEVDRMTDEEAIAATDKLTELIGVNRDNFHKKTAEFLDQHLQRLEDYFAGETFTDISEKHNLHRSFVSTWHGRFAEGIGRVIARRTLASSLRGEQGAAQTELEAADVSPMEAQIIATSSEQRDGRLFTKISIAPQTRVFEEGYIRKPAPEMRTSIYELWERER